MCVVQTRPPTVSHTWLQSYLVTLWLLHLGTGLRRSGFMVTRPSTSRIEKQNQKKIKKLQISFGNGCFCVPVTPGRPQAPPHPGFLPSGHTLFRGSYVGKTKAASCLHAFCSQKSDNLMHPKPPHVLAKRPLR
ncbi:hypothetical protein VULLAG_LOCUS2977 [Vulpes lagopus]